MLMPLLAAAAMQAAQPPAVTELTVGEVEPLAGREEAISLASRVLPADLGARVVY